MTGPHVPEINVDEIMKKIREEVRRRKAGQNGTNGDISPQGTKDLTVSPSAKQSQLWKALKAIQMKLRRYPFYGIAYRTALRFTRFIPKYQTTSTIADFLQYDDEAFIKYAYKGILNREADEQGLGFYLPMLRTGRLNKAQILASLRYSKEGKEKKNNIKGLYRSYIAVKLYKLPIIGYVIRWTTTILKMPLIVRNITAFENYTNTRFNHLGGQLNRAVEQLSHGIEQKADNRRVEQLIHEVEQKAESRLVRADIDNIIQQIRDQKLNILAQQKNLSSFLERLNREVSEGHTDKGQKALTEEQEHIYDALYVSFEDRFRGTQANIKERQRVYLPYVHEALKNTDNAMVLDVGCGRGEWLGLLKEQKINAQGIDINRIMAAQAKELGLDVAEADVVEYLKNRKDNVLSAITGFHIVEHLPFEVMIKLFDESLRVLKAGGMVIFETPNPENLMVGAYTFYYDPTHLHPIPPDTLKFIAEARGFTNVRILRLHRRNEQTSSVSDPIHELIERMDMEQDYAVVGYKG